MDRQQPYVNDDLDDVLQHNQNADSSGIHPDEADDSERRYRTLERNRAAAARCRQRKKQWVDGLRRQQEELLKQNERLYHAATQLQDEVFKLKSDILLHNGCNCLAIREFIQKTLMKDVVQNQETENRIDGTDPEEPTDQPYNPTFQ